MTATATASSRYFDPEVPASVLRRASALRMVVFDVDGVLTDGRVQFDAAGLEIKRFHTRDGLGMRLLLLAGFDLAVISGRRSPQVEQRMQALGVKHIIQGVDDKLPVFTELLDSLALTPDQAAYVGDDLIDLPVLTRCGLGICVADAHRAVRAHADWQTEAEGGAGAAREVCDLVLYANGLLDQTVARYLAADIP